MAYDQLMVNWWFGLVVWIPGIPLWKGTQTANLPFVDMIVIKQNQNRQLELQVTMVFLPCDLEDSGAL